MSATEPQVQAPQKKVTVDDLIKEVKVIGATVEAALGLFKADLDSHTVPEMPYSWNAYMIAPDGSKEQFTVRKTDAADYVKSIAGIKKHLAEQGYKPVAAKEETGNGGTNATTGGEVAPKCAIHGTPMAKRQRKDGSGSFWSCPKKLDDGTYCPYKPKQA